MTHPPQAYFAIAEKWRKEREENLKTGRADLIGQLRKLGIAQVTADYEGYGDSGNVEDVTVLPDDITLSDDLERAVSDFAWSLAYHQHPGFENNEGGYGTLTWDIAADSITLDHADRFVDCTHSCDEGL